jgi:hypothetical protein
MNLSTSSTPQDDVLKIQVPHSDSEESECDTSPCKKPSSKSDKIEKKSANGMMEFSGVKVSSESKHQAKLWEMIRFRTKSSIAKKKADKEKKEKKEKKNKEKKGAA